MSHYREKSKGNVESGKVLSDADCGHARRALLSQVQADSIWHIQTQKRTFFLKMQTIFPITCTFAFLSFPGLNDRGMGRENLKSPVDGISTPLDAYSPIGEFCVLILL